MHQHLRLRIVALVSCAILAACGGGGGGSDHSAPPASAPAMIVTPEGVFASLGVQGGPFAPGATTFTVRNAGKAAFTWAAQPSEAWLNVSLTSGSLLPGEESVLLVNLDPSASGRLLPGIHTASVDFRNTTSGSGSTSRGINLTVFPGPTLGVVPRYGFTASGPVGGPFAPTNTIYTLTNPTQTPIDWFASVNTVGVSLSSNSGTLAAGAQEPVTITFDPGLAASLPLGNQQAVLTFLDFTNGITITRGLSLNINAGPGGALARSISQFGITWTFSKDELVGQFANGDWWVVGPVVITNIDPPSDVALSGRITNGSMTDPSPRYGVSQGYDNGTYGQYALPGYFSAALNAALAVSPQVPLPLQGGTSLVSTISELEPGMRPQLTSAAVLTVLDAAPAPGSFRPSYSGSDKTIRFNEAQLDRTLLQKLPAVASTPTFAEVEGWFERPWIDHVPVWVGCYLHPSQNMPYYGRDMCDQVSVASLMLHLDVPDAQKETLLIRFVQLGIDLWGIAQDGGDWAGTAGQMSGRKWPILFAGLMLGDAAMSNVGFDASISFGEDDQTFYVQETPPGSGVYNNGYGGYRAQHVGMAEWGTEHSYNPSLDDVDWLGDPYRLCCTANSWWGELLACYVMGAKPLWNHDALFDYQDRYLSENQSRGILDWRLSWQPFYLDMWNQYRASY